MKRWIAPASAFGALAVAALHAAGGMPAPVALWCAACLACAAAGAGAMARES